MVMEATSMDLKVISGKDLKAFNFFQKLTLYALVLIVSDDPQKELDKKEKQQQRTPTDRDEDGDGSNPEWNHEMRFDLELISSHDYENLFVLFELRHEGLVFGDKTIGEVRVPLKDLIQEPNNGVVRFVTYEVRTIDGKPNGSLKFSYRVNGKGSGAYTYSSQFPETNMNITGYSFLEAINHPRSNIPIWKSEAHRLDSAILRWIHH
ncbi:protein SRC2-like [Quillaja saponaria]|uniref:Protein SRC2-like n=1 Tax=Quillaja saponaria TaxID=32244 RepID=A0AAD7VI34_QUISA|nr:protein SRC2-like [Quillaja saponaria]